MKSGRIIIGIIVVVAIVILGIYFWPDFKKVDELSCNSNTDCICGVHINTEDCFYGNKNYVNTDSSKTCPDFCSGIAGNLEIKCVENKCKQVSNCYPKGHSCGGAPPSPGSEVTTCCGGLTCELPSPSDELGTCQQKIPYGDDGILIQYCEYEPTNTDCVCKDGIRQQVKCGEGENCLAVVAFECVPGNYVKGEILVGFSQSMSESEILNYISSKGLEIKSLSLGSYTIKVSIGSEQKWINTFLKEGKVRYAELNIIITGQGN